MVQSFWFVKMLSDLIFEVLGWKCAWIRLNVHIDVLHKQAFALCISVIGRIGICTKETIKSNIAVI